MKKIMFALMFISVSAQAASHPPVPVTDTKKVTILDLGNYSIDCQPGIASNGHNFPTVSYMSFYQLDSVFPVTNISVVTVSDPKTRIGDHCEELKKEVTAALPGEFTFTRTRSQQYSWTNGLCAAISVEDITVTIGDFQFSGSASFDLGEVNEHFCR